jgi:hypothetical protein
MHPGVPPVVFDLAPELELERLLKGTKILVYVSGFAKLGKDKNSRHCQMLATIAREHSDPPS